MAFSALIPLILLAISATASPFVYERETEEFSRALSSLTLKTVLKTDGGLKALVKSDLARAKKYMNRQKSGQEAALVDPQFAVEDSVPLSNVGALLAVQMGVGTPSTPYDLIVDTGSSNTFVGANKQYSKTESSKDTGNRVAVSYGSGSFEGEEFTDTVTLGNVSVSQQSIGVASTSQGFDNFDGILGLGPAALTRGTVQNTPTVPTVIDTLAQENRIPQALMGLSILPTNPAGDSSGDSLDLGVPDESKITGEIKYVPITQQEPANSFWGIEQSISYGSDKTPIMKSSAGILDSGTTLLLIASDAFQAYKQATGATPDDTTGLLKVDSVDKLQSLFFNIGNNMFEFTPNAQIWPRSLNTAMGGDANATYLVVSDMGQPSGQGLDFINGFSFLQRFYSVYDTTNSQVGLATTPFTNATSN